MVRTQRNINAKKNSKTKKNKNDNKQLREQKYKQIKNLNGQTVRWTDRGHVN